MARRPPDEPGTDPADEPTAASDARRRILDAAFALLREDGYAATGTREIAARARVSKRELYSEFGSKEGIFGALIETRAALMRAPLEAPAPPVGDAAALRDHLARAGTTFLELLCDPAVVSVFRLAISAAEHSPELSQVLDRHARTPYRRALVALMARARRTGLLRGSPDELAGRFLALLVGDLHVALLLGLTEPPPPRDLAARARAATQAFLELCGGPG